MCTSLRCLNGIYADPFRQWSTPELIKIGTSAAPTFPPGTSWAYSHTNFAILGTVLAQVGVKPLSKLMNQYIFEPMGLDANTKLRYSADPRAGAAHLQLRTPRGAGHPGGHIVLRGVHLLESVVDGRLRVPWETTDIADLTTSIDAIGSGKLLSPVVAPPSRSIPPLSGSA